MRPFAFRLRGQRDKLVAPYLLCRAVGHFSHDRVDREGEMSVWVVWVGEDLRTRPPRLGRFCTLPIILERRFARVLHEDCFPVRLQRVCVVQGERRRRRFETYARHLVLLHRHLWRRRYVNYGSRLRRRPPHLASVLPEIAYAEHDDAQRDHRQRETAEHSAEREAPAAT